MVFIDAVSRYVDGVISSESIIDESFSNGNLLEYPQYTRPEEFHGMKVPEVLLSRTS
jgi:tRNA (guanine37-N1)-methyltransferase